MKTRIPTILLFLALLVNQTVSRELAPVSNLTFYGVWIGAGPDAIITKFESTVIIPTVSPDKTPSNDVQSFWPGMEPKTMNGVFQNVITNQAAEPGEWYLLPFYCCNPATNLTELPGMRVWPGDSIKNVFSLDIPTGNWYNNWVVTPGVQGHAAGQTPFGGGFEFNPTIDNVTNGEPYTSALITIELQDQGTWDFGSITWTNIILEANTTDTKWCTDGPTATSNWTWNAAPGTWHTSDENMTTCFFPSLILEGPEPMAPMSQNRTTNLLSPRKPDVTPFLS